MRFSEKNIKFIDLFAGIGGFRYAMQQAADSLGDDERTGALSR